MQRAPEPDLTQVRTIFNRARQQADLTFEELAELSGVSRQTLLNISGGKYYGDLRTWLKLSHALDTRLDDLMGPVWGSPSGPSGMRPTK